jgi:hypothetical protein
MDSHASTLSGAVEWRRAPFFAARSSFLRRTPLFCGARPFCAFFATRPFAARKLNARHKDLAMLAAQAQRRVYRNALAMLSRPFCGARRFILHFRLLCVFYSTSKQFSEVS